MKNNNWNLLV